MTARDVRVPDSSHEFKIINTNARSILNRPVELEDILHEHEPLVVAITEIWLPPGIGDDEIFPAAYRIFKKGREGRSGGVDVLIE